MANLLLVRRKLTTFDRHAVQVVGRRSKSLFAKDKDGHYRTRNHGVIAANSEILVEGGAKSDALAMETAVETLPADMRIVALAWSELSDDAKRSILFIVRDDTRAGRTELS